MYFKIVFSNGFFGYDEEIYIEVKNEIEASKYAEEYFYEDASRCINDIDDYDTEEEYWEVFEEYQANCTYEINEISKEEYLDYYTEVI